jgi:hypothetical protein
VSSVKGLGSMLCGLAWSMIGGWCGRSRFRSCS